MCVVGGLVGGLLVVWGWLGWDDRFDVGMAGVVVVVGWIEGVCAVGFLGR